MTLKKWLCLALCACLLLSLAACGSKEKKDTPIETLPAVPTAPQKEYTEDMIKDMYNEALKKLTDSKSYHMSGSWNSTTVFGDVIATVVTSVDCKYRLKDGGIVSFFDAQMHRDGVEIPHTTYYDGENYYFYAYDWKYYTNTNDYNDYFALDYLKPVGDVALQDLEVMDQLDGSVEISFSLPMGEYNSDAVLGLIGEGTQSATIDEDLISLSLNIDENGALTYFYISFNSKLLMLDEEVEQTVVVSMSLDGYDATTVEAPTDLGSYENNIAETLPEGQDQGHVGILTPEDVD